MSEKKLTNILVKTVPNGYVMVVGGNEYMAFSEEQLVNIFFAHVAVGEKKYLDQDMTAALIEAAATWSDKGEAITAVATWMTTARKAVKKEAAATRGMVNANERAEKMEDEIADLKKENNELRAEIVKLRRIGTALVGGGHPDVIEEATKKKVDYKIRKIDFEDDTKIAKRRGRKPGSGKTATKKTKKKKATKK